MSDINNSRQIFVVKAMTAINGIDVSINEWIDAKVKAIDAMYPEKRIDVSGPLQKLKREIESGSDLGKGLKERISGSNKNAPDSNEELDMAVGEYMGFIGNELDEQMKKHSPQMAEFVDEQNQLKSKADLIKSTVNESNIIEYFAGTGVHSEITEHLRALLPTATFEELQNAARQIKITTDLKISKKISYRKFWLPVTCIIFLGLVAFLGIVSSEELTIPYYAGIAFLSLIVGQVFGGTVYVVYRLFDRYRRIKPVLDERENLQKYLTSAWEELTANFEQIRDKSKDSVKNVKRRLDEFEELSKLTIVRNDEFLKHHVAMIRKNYSYLYAIGIFSYGNRFISEDIKKAGEIHGYLLSYLKANMDIVGIDRQLYGQLIEEIVAFAKSKGEIERPALLEAVRSIADKIFGKFEDAEAIGNPLDLVRTMVDCFCTTIFANQNQKK